MSKSRFAFIAIRLIVELALLYWGVSFIYQGVFTATITVAELIYEVTSNKRNGK